MIQIFNWNKKMSSLSNNFHYNYNLTRKEKETLNSIFINLSPSICTPSSMITRTSLLHMKTSLNKKKVKELNMKSNKIKEIHWNYRLWVNQVQTKDFPETQKSINKTSSKKLTSKTKYLWTRKTIGNKWIGIHSQY